MKERLILAEKLTEERKGTSPGVAAPSASSSAGTTPAGNVPPRSSGSFQAVAPGASASSASAAATPGGTGQAKK